MHAFRSIGFALAAVVALSGCANAPSGPFIVLHRPSPAPRVVKLPVPPIPDATVAAQNDAAPLSASDKDSLFRAFNNFLDTPGAAK